jgi:hypothetical protein
MPQGNFLLNEKLRLDGKLADLDQNLATKSPEHFKKLRCSDSVQTFTECASKTGIAVSLIEGIIATSRVLWMMDLSSPEIQEALKDLKDTYELQTIMTLETESPQGRMNDEEWRKR